MYYDFLHGLFCFRDPAIIQKGAFADGDGREMIVQCAFENMDV